MKKKLLCVSLALLCTTLAFTQSSEILSEIIDSEKATCAQISYLPALYESQNQEDSGSAQLGTMSASKLEKASTAETFNLLKSESYFDSADEADSQATIARTAFVYMKALGIKGGLFYSLFPSPRYAFKELKAKGILPSETDPDMKLSGRESIDLFNQCLEIAGGAQ